jgi:uncharacterized repeat protein (TIGR01451 family)
MLPLILFGAGQFLAAALPGMVVDDLQTAQAAITLTSPGTDSSTVNDSGSGSILDEDRDMVLSLDSGSSASTEVTSAVFSFSVTGGSTGSAELTWDADSDASLLDPEGLGGPGTGSGNSVDLTDGGSDSGLSFTIVSATGGAVLEIQIWSDASRSSTFRLTLPAITAATSYHAPYAGFLPDTGSTGADFTDVGAIQLRLSGTDVSVDVTGPLQSAPGGPGIGATKVDALVVDSDLDSEADPGETLEYTITIRNTGDGATDVEFTDPLDANPDLIFVAGSLDTTPLALNDSYDCLGNVGIDVPGGSGVLANDRDPDETGLAATAISAFDSTSAAGATVVVSQTDGAFTYDPPPGFKGADSFTYTIDDGEGNSDTATVLINVSGRIWFIDNSAPGSGDGCLNSPFDTLAAFETVNGNGGAADPAAGDCIFLSTGSGSYQGGITLEDNQTLIGQGAAGTLADICSLSLPAFSNPLPATGGTRPTVVHASGNAVTVASSNTLRGLDVGDTPPANSRLVGNGVGTLTIAEMSVAGSSATGGALSIAGGGTLDVTFDSIRSTASSVGASISLSGLGGSLTVLNGAGSDTSISGAALGVDIQGAAAGSSFSFGDSDITGAGGINLASNNATSVFTFDSLSVGATAGAGVRASSSGTVNIGGTANSVTASGGPAVDITSTTLDGNGGGVTFASLTSSGSPTDGIVLNSIAGDFSVTGLTDIDNPTNEGIDIDNTGSAVDLNLSTVDILDPGGNGIDLDGIAGSFTITSNGGGVVFSGPANDHGVMVNNSSSVTIQGTDPGGAANCKTASSSCFLISGAGTSADSIPANGITATDVVTLTLSFLEITNIGEAGNTNADNEDAINVDDGITSFTLSNSYIHDLSMQTGAFESRDGAPTGFAGTVAMNFTDNIFEGNGSDHTSTDESIFIDFATATGATLLATITDNVFDGVRAGPNVDVDGDSGTGGGGRNVITISGNVIQNLDGNAIASDIGGAGGDLTQSSTDSYTEIAIDDNTLDAYLHPNYIECDGILGAGTGCMPREAIAVTVRTDTSGVLLDALIRNNTIRSTLANGDPTRRWDFSGITVESHSTQSFSNPTLGTIRGLIEGNNIDDTDDEGIGIGPDESIGISARVINNVMGDNVGAAGLDEGIHAQLRESSSVEFRMLRVFFSGNESGAGAIDDWRFGNALHLPGTFELGCTEDPANLAFCLDGTAIGTMFSAGDFPAADPTLENLLATEGNRRLDPEPDRGHRPGGRHP